jgi:glutamine synthetase
MTPLAGYDLTGWHNGFGDLTVIPDLTLRRLSYLPGTFFVHGDAAHRDGRLVDVAPRRMLRQQIEALAHLGLYLQVSIEGEFVAYQGSAARIRRAGYRERAPVSSDNLDYALSRPSALHAFFRDPCGALRQAGTPVEAIKAEGALGQCEVTWPYGEPVPACDTYTLCKHAVRHIAAQHHMTPTFMAAPQTGVGSGMHLHVSLADEDDKPVFTTAPGNELPELLQRSIAGLIAALPHLTPLYAPAVPNIPVQPNG